jgi:hypothetical protein
MNCRRSAPLSAVSDVVVVVAGVALAFMTSVVALATAALKTEKADGQALEVEGSGSEMLHVGGRRLQLVKGMLLRLRPCTASAPTKVEVAGGVIVHV